VWQSHLGKEKKVQQSNRFLIDKKAGSDARHEYVLTTSARGGDPIQFYIEMACNGMFGAGNGLIGPPDPNRFFNLNELVRTKYT
jgi:hypothetical protein